MPATLFLLLFFVSLVLLLHAGRRANRTDWGSATLNLLEGINRIFCRRYHRLQAEEIPLPVAGPAIVVANHVSGLDPMLMIASSPRPLRFLIAREQYERFGLQWLFRAVGCIPIDRSKQADNAMRLAIRALHQGEVLAIFPHGRIHLPEEPPLKLKPGAARLAVKVSCPVYPVRVSGVAAMGGVMLPVLLRGNTKLDYCDVIPAESGSQDIITERIRACIEAG